MSNRRRTLIVKRDEQLRVIFACVLATVLLLNFLLLLAMFSYPTLVQRFDLLNTAALVGAEAVVVGIISYFSLLVSHRIAGPAYGLVRDLQRIEKGDLTVRTKLRQGDFFMDVGQALRATSEATCERVKHLKTLVNALGDSEGLSGETRELVDKLQHELAKFKTEVPPRTEGTQKNQHGAG